MNDQDSLDAARAAISKAGSSSLVTIGRMRLLRSSILPLWLVGVLCGWLLCVWSLQSYVDGLSAPREVQSYAGFCALVLTIYALFLAARARRIAAWICTALNLPD